MVGGLVGPHELVELVELLFLHGHVFGEQELALADQVDVFGFLPLAIHFLPADQLLFLQKVLKSIKLLGRPKVEERERLQELINLCLVFLFYLLDESLVVGLAQRHQLAIGEADGRTGAIVCDVGFEGPLAKRLTHSILADRFKPLSRKNRSLLLLWDRSKHSGLHDQIIYLVHSKSADFIVF